MRRAALLILSIVIFQQHSVFAQLLPQASPQEVGLSKERLDRIKPFLENYIAQNKLAGGNALIARRGKIAYFETFGMMDKEGGKPATKDAIFRIYSMSKPIVTVRRQNRIRAGFRVSASRYEDVWTY
jgi:CubicO group peptidase (beta-lactamase class C family)